MPLLNRVNFNFGNRQSRNIGKKLIIFAVGLLLIFALFILFIEKSEDQLNNAVAKANRPQYEAQVFPQKSSSPPRKVADLNENRIWELWRFNSPNERLELIRLLQNYGFSGPLAIPLLKNFLGHPHQSIRQAAMRGLAATQAYEAISILQEFIKDAVPIEESTEAALALATIEDTTVSPILKAALDRNRDLTLREHLVDALASRPQAEASSFIDEFMQRSDVEIAEKQNLLRMAGLNNAKNAEFLAGYLDSADEELRYGAYQGLALNSDSRLTQMLIPKVKAETDPSNRALVYEALGNQLDANSLSLGSLADSEENEYARLRALKAWTEAAARQNTPLLADVSSSNRIAELQNAALKHEDFAERRVALIALAFVRYDQTARAAIDLIARESSSPKIRALAQGLLNNQP